MNPLILLFKAYWMQLTALALCLFIVGLIGYQRHEINGLKRDKIILQQTIDLTKAIGQAANEKADRIEQGAHAAAIASTNQYLSDLEKVKKYNETHPVIKHITDSVRQPSTNSGSSQMSGLPQSPQGTSSNGQDSDAAIIGTILEQSCAITTLQYNALHDAWDKACLAFGCN